mmetsp:Transcript_15925/g.41177  ORF Transcript_15925/g.41177 Transcript_15925/m.41177 type:complete len:272 (-) Transcript_15925:1058-1873(-)
MRLLLTVRFQTPNEVRLALAHAVHKISERSRKNGNKRGGLFPAPRLVRRTARVKQLGKQRILTRDKHLCDVIGKLVAVFVEKRLGAVRDLTSIMCDLKVEVAVGPRGLERLRSMRFEAIATLLCECEVRRLGKTRLLIEDGKNSTFLEEEIKRRLVVRKLDLVQADTLFLVLILLCNKDMVIEVSLQLLVRQINAHLLERVDFENLESKDIEDANGAGVFSSGRRVHENLVTQLENPHEDLEKDHLRHGVAVRGSCFLVKVLHDLLAPCHL